MMDGITKQATFLAITLIAGASLIATYFQDKGPDRQGSGAILSSETNQCTTPDNHDVYFVGCGGLL